MKLSHRIKKFLLKSIRPLGAVILFLTSFLLLTTSEFYGTISMQERLTDKSGFFKFFLDFNMSVENQFFDYRLRKTIKDNPPSKEIVLVEIDDYSLSQIGQWPLSRTIYADFLRKLSFFGARTVAFDVLFPERSPGEGPNSPDAQMIQAFKDFQTAERQAFVGYSVIEGAAPDEEKILDFPPELFDFMANTKQEDGANLISKAISAYNYPFEGLAQSGVGLGYITAEPDNDGVFREYQLIANVDQFYVGSLGFNAYESWSGKKNTITIHKAGDGVEASIMIKDKKLDIDDFGKTKVRYYGGLEQFPHTSLYTVLKAANTDEEMKNFFQDKLVFLGSTASGAHDLRHSPLASDMPGVLVHMNMAHMLIHGHFFKPKNESFKFSLILLFGGVFILMLVRRFDNPFVDALTLAAILGGSFYADANYFMREGYQVKLSYCYLCFVGIYSWYTFLNFYEAQKEKRQIRSTFARYVAPTVVEEMLKDPEHIAVGGTRMDITCLFSDVRDFTSISEGLSAQDLANMLNEYMSRMTDIVFDTKGTLDKYIGDAIVAIWGAPVPIGNHAQFAVEAAVRMAEAMPAINAEFKQRNLPFFNVGIGLNTGECSVGNMGSTRIFSYTALGDNMNLGARLEGLCKYYGTQILISENTLERIDKERFPHRPIDKMIVKGRTKPVEIYEVLSQVHPMTKNNEALKLYLKAHGLFSQKNFKEALEGLEEVLTHLPEDKATKRLKALCEKYLSDPSLVTEDFDVTKMTEK